MKKGVQKPPSPTLNDDLLKMHGRWSRESRGKNPYATTFWFEVGEDHRPHVSIQDSRFGGSDRPYPLFPYFDFDLKATSTGRAIVPRTVVSLEPVPESIAYRLNGDKLVIESGEIVIRHGKGKQAVKLKGTYRFEPGS